MCHVPCFHFSWTSRSVVQRLLAVGLATRAHRSPALATGNIVSCWPNLCWTWPKCAYATATADAASPKLPHLHCPWDADFWGLYLYPCDSTPCHRHVSTDTPYQLHVTNTPLSQGCLLVRGFNAAWNFTVNLLNRSVLLLSRHYLANA